MFALDLDPVKTSFKLERSAVAVGFFLFLFSFFLFLKVCSSAAAFTAHNNQIIVFLKAVFQPNPKCFWAQRPTVASLLFFSSSSQIPRGRRHSILSNTLLWCQSHPRCALGTSVDATLSGEPILSGAIGSQTQVPTQGPTLEDFTFSRDSQNVLLFFFWTKAWRKSSTQTGFWGCCSGCINYCIPWWMRHCWGGEGRKRRRGGCWYSGTRRPPMTWLQMSSFFIAHSHSHTHTREGGKKQTVCDECTSTWS